MARSEVQNINIVSNNYSRYGTSIYQQLYNTPSSKKYGSTTASSYLVPASNKNNTSTSHITTNTRVIADNESLMSVGSKKSRIKRKYKSLISSGSKKLINKIYDHGSSDTFSIFSLKSHKEKDFSNINTDICFLPTFTESLATINDLPLELLSRIISYIGYDKHYNTLVYCLYVSKRWYKATKIVLYRQPRFVSTYRVAQFVTSLRLHPENGNLVKILKLSDLQNGLIFKEHDNEDEEEGASDMDESLSEGDNDEQNNIEENGNGVAPNENGRNNNNNVNNSEPLSDIAYAGWRDWRYRNDPLYSSPVLNSYTVRRIVSRSSSIHSNSSVFTSLSNGSIISMNTSVSTRNEPSNNNNSDTPQNTSNRVRSNSSVSSITSSIMSTFQNTSHISLTSSPLVNNTNGNFNKGEGNNLNDNKNVSQQNSMSTCQDTDNKWFRFKVMSKNKRRARNLTKYSTINATQQKNYLYKNKDKSYTNISKNVESTGTNKVNGINNSDMANTTSSQIRFAIERPFKTNHPYTNKFLLKYASCKDLPLGYILHILNHCPNLAELDLSNLTIYDDFKIINKSKHHKRLTSLILPSVEESTVMTNSEENRLEVVYATDSSKNYEHNKDVIVNTGNSRSRRNSRIGQGVVLTSNSDSSLNRPPSIISCNSLSNISNNDITGLNPDYWFSKSISTRSDYPLPIDSQTKARAMAKSRWNNNKNSSDDVELYKLNPVEIFEILCTKLKQLTKIKMDGAVWCRQYMIKYFILIIFQKIIDYDVHNSPNTYLIDMNRHNKIMDLSFLKAGMNRNFPWSCKGTFSDFVALLVLDELLKNDDLTIEDLFNIKSERLYQNENLVTDSDVMEISNIFPIKFGLDKENQDMINFRIVVLKNKRRTSYILKKVSNDYVSLIVNLCINENYNFMVSSADSGILPKETPKRIDRLAHGLVARIRYLRDNDLRRHVGENNYISNTANII